MNWLEIILWGLAGWTAASFMFGAGWAVARHRFKKREPKADWSFPGKPMRVIEAEFETVARRMEGAI